MREAGVRQPPISILVAYVLQMRDSLRSLTAIAPSPCRSKRDVPKVLLLLLNWEKMFVVALKLQSTPILR